MNTNMTDEAFIEAMKQMDINDTEPVRNPPESLKLDVFLNGVQREYERASKKHKEFSSYHEGLAVIWEEFEELKEEVFKKVPDEDNLHSELVQIAAMCLKFYNNLMKED